MKIRLSSGNSQLVASRLDPGPGSKARGEKVMGWRNQRWHAWWNGWRLNLRDSLETNKQTNKISESTGDLFCLMI